MRGRDGQHQEGEEAEAQQQHAPRQAKVEERTEKLVEIVTTGATVEFRSPPEPLADGLALSDEPEF